MVGRKVYNFDFISGSQIDFANDRIPVLDMSETGTGRSKITSPTELLSGFVVTPSTGYLTGYVSKTESGDFYPKTNPSGFITGVDLSNYSTIAYVTGVSGDLQLQVTILNNTTGSFYLNSNPSGFITGVDLSSYVTGSVVRPSETGAFLTSETSDLRYVGLTGNQTISGVKTFDVRPLVNGTGILLSGESNAGYTFTSGLSEITGVVTVNIIQNITNLSNLSSNGVVKTSGSNGSLWVDTGVYLVYEQQTNVPIPTGGSVIDDEARSTLSGIITRLQSLGLFA